jgi:hypothetical protein
MFQYKRSMISCFTKVSPVDKTNDDTSRQAQALQNENLIGTTTPTNIPLADTLIGTIIQALATQETKQQQQQQQQHQRPAIAL